MQALCEVVQGQSPPGDTYNTRGEGLPFFQGKAEFGELHPVPVKWCKAPKKVAFPGDVLISVRAPVGPTNLCAVECCIGRGLAACRPAEGIESRYLLYALRDSQERLAELGTGSTFDAIGGSDLRSHEVPVAPNSEQSRIVAEVEKQLTRLGAAAAALEHAQEQLKRYRASVLKAACEGRLVPTEAELARAEGRSYESGSDLLRRIGDGRGDLQSEEKSPTPEGWARAKLAEVAEIKGGIQKQPSRAPVKNRYPFLRVANVLRGRLDLSEIHEVELFGQELEKLRLAQGDLLIVEGNGSPSEIGRMAIWRGKIEDSVHQNHIIRARLFGGILPEYVALYWNSLEGTAQVLEVASSTSGLYTLSVRKVGRLSLPIPPLLEQQRIVSEAERRLSIVDSIENVVRVGLTRASRLRQAILKKAFEGRLVPHDPADEPASELLARIQASRAATAEVKQPRPIRRAKPQVATQRVS